MPKEYVIHKGLLKPVELKGLRSKYIVIAGGGAVAGLVIAFVGSFIAGVVIVAAAIIAAYYLNDKYGVDGFSIMMAQRGCCKYMVNRKRVFRIVKVNGKGD